MKIVHIMLSCFYIDGFSYQENLIPKYHHKMGYDVEVISSLFSFDNQGGGYYETKYRKYVNKDSIKVSRLEFEPIPFVRTLRVYKGLEAHLEKAKPDIIFIHGVSFLDILKIQKYKIQHPEVILYIDNHADLQNSAQNWLSKNILHGMIWRYCAKRVEPYTDKFFGVTPARVDFLVNMYHIKPSNVELLVMGADDEAIKRTVSTEGRQNIRNSLGIGKNDILLLTAGKIDRNKVQVLNLMQAVLVMNHPNVKLVVFGSVQQELKTKFDGLVDGKKVVYMGWLKPEDTYRYFDSADLVVFPGLHSVYWEQAVGCGCACVFRKIDGFTHVDVGGNCMFIEDDSADGIGQVLDQLTSNPEKIRQMREIASEKGKAMFSYSRIAKQSIGMS